MQEVGTEKFRAKNASLATLAQVRPAALVVHDEDVAVDIQGAEILRGIVSEALHLIDRARARSADEDAVVYGIADKARGGLVVHPIHVRIEVGPLVAGHVKSTAGFEGIVFHSADSGPQAAHDHIGGPGRVRGPPKRVGLGENRFGGGGGKGHGAKETEQGRACAEGTWAGIFGYGGHVHLREVFIDRISWSPGKAKGCRRARRE